MAAGSNTLEVINIAVANTVQYDADEPRPAPTGMPDFKTNFPGRRLMVKMELYVNCPFAVSKQRGYEKLS